jgi:pimeloyl-ACP methyl ester carboxylesterase/DNA-binding CsgD family transcriptional regulator
MNQQIRFCTSTDGTKIAYAISGEGPPLLMSMTWVTHLEHAARSLAWQGWLESLSHEYTLLRYDCRGCGLSDRQVRSQSFDAWVADLDAVVKAAGFNRFDMLGICSGGPVVIAYAARHPERVNKLVLYGTYGRGRFKRADVPDEAEKGRLLLAMTKLGWAQENHPFLKAWASSFQPGGTIEHLRSWCALQRASTCAETAVSMFQTVGDVDVRSMASQLRCPTLVLHAERDAVAPMDEGRLLAGIVPNARFVQLDSDNHILIPGEPAWTRFLSEIRGFLHVRNLDRDAGLLGDRFAALTQREVEILEGIAQGLDNTQIATDLGLSEKTVRNHVTRLFDKLTVNSRARAIVLARKAGFGQGNRPGPASRLPV